MSDRFDEIAPIRAPHDPGDAPPEPDPDEVEEVEEESGLISMDPVDPLKRGEEPDEQQPGLDPPVGPIPPG